MTKKELSESAKNLIKAFVRARDFDYLNFPDTKPDAPEEIPPLWELLGYKEMPKDACPLQAALVKFVCEKLTGIEKEILLMSFGFLRGYDDGSGIGGRRELCLRGSSYFEIMDSKNYKKYLDNSISEADRLSIWGHAIRNLSKREDRLNEKLAKILDEVIDLPAYSKDIQCYLLKNKLNKDAIPEPVSCLRLKPADEWLPMPEDIVQIESNKGGYGSSQVAENPFAQAIENIRLGQAVYFAEFKQINALNIDSTILPSLKPPIGEAVELRTVLFNHTANSVILLCGAGGIGKSYIIFACCEELQRDETFNEYKLVPIFVPMKEVVGSEESPILNYAFDNQFASLDCVRDSNSIKKAVRDLALNGTVKFVFFLDGLNEFALSASENENRVVHDEIKWLQCLKNIIVVVSTRSDKGFYKHYKLQVNELGSQQVEDYLEKHKNTALFNQSPLKSKKLLGLLKNPLLLALFTKTYSHEYTELNDMRMETHADILRLCVEYQKNHLRGTSRANFALDVLLPLVTLSTDMKLQLEAGSLAEELRRKLQITLSEAYKPLWFQGYQRKDFTGLDLADETVLFYDLIGNTILENGVFLTQHKNTVSWQHELLMEWFAARAIVIALEYQRDYAVEKIAEICRSLMANDEKISRVLPTALFLFEMLESTKESDSNEFIELVSAIARSYSDIKDDLNTYKFATIALSKMEKGYMEGYPRWKFAKLRNNVAYRLLSVRAAGEDFNREKCVDYASQIINDSLQMLQHEPGEGAPKDIKLAEAQIHGNLGASCLARYELTKDPAWIYKAISHHKDGLEARRFAFADDPDCDMARRVEGTSYHCFATDYFKLGSHEDSLHNHEQAAEHYRRSLENHRQAAALREIGHANDPEKLTSYGAYIGTLVKLLANTYNAEYIKEALRILKKLLKLDPDDTMTILSVESLLRNGTMLETMRNHCAALIVLTCANTETVTAEDMAVLREAAARIDQYCHEVLIDSDLLAQII